uniref:Uncharacterized protein n=1 Tax=Spironucleus salmonicida TaxID=348837 RepID=V6LH17_9EUKA|eukprot:EST43006.1 Hypothetical protein SS50377_17307 [Spironucleus salmonicida]
MERVECGAGRDQLDHPLRHLADLREALLVEHVHQPCQLRPVQKPAQLLGLRVEVAAPRLQGEEVQHREALPAAHPVELEQERQHRSLVQVPLKLRRVPREYRCQLLRPLRAELVHLLHDQAVPRDFSELLRPERRLEHLPHEEHVRLEWVLRELLQNVEVDVVQLLVQVPRVSQRLAKEHQLELLEHVDLWRERVPAVHGLQAEGAQLLAEPDQAQHLAPGQHELLIEHARAHQKLPGALAVQEGLDLAVETELAHPGEVDLQAALYELALILVKLRQREVDLYLAPKIVAPLDPLQVADLNELLGILQRLALVAVLDLGPDLLQQVQRPPRESLLDLVQLARSKVLNEHGQHWQGHPLQRLVRILVQRDELALLLHLGMIGSVALQQLRERRPRCGVPQLLGSPRAVAELFLQHPQRARPSELQECREGHCGELGEELVLRGQLGPVPQVAGKQQREDEELRLLFERSTAKHAQVREISLEFGKKCRTELAARYDLDARDNGCQAVDEVHVRFCEAHVLKVIALLQLLI